MYQWTKLIVIVAALAFVADSAKSQQAEGRGRFEGRGGFGGGFPPEFFPGIVIMAALDADKDGALSADEIANATEALKKLDKNGDGKVGRDEIRTELEKLRPPRRERGGGGGFGRGSRVGGGGFGRGSFLDRIMEHDKNADGKISASELPAVMAGLMDRGDKNKDGFLEKSEIETLSQNLGNRNRGRGGPGGNREGRPARPARPE